MFYLSGQGGKNTIKSMQKEDIFINNIIFTNPIYKHFLHIDRKESNSDIEKMIKSKKDILIWLNIIMNTILFEGSSLFKNANELYETFYAIKFEYKLNRNNYEEEKITNNYNKFSDDIEEQFKYCESDLVTDFFNIKNNPISFQQASPSICDKCFDSQLNFNLDSQAYVFYLSNDKRIISSGNQSEELNKFIEMIKEQMIYSNNLRELKVSFNFNHKVMETIVKCDITFTITSLGTVITKLNKYVIDTTKNDSLLFNIITYFIEIVKYLFILYTLFTIFAFFVKSKRLNMLIFDILFDIFICCFLVSSYVLSLQKYSLNNVFDDIKISSIEEATSKVYDLFEYKDYEKFITQRNQSIQIDAILILVFFIRNVFVLKTSPIINLIFQIIQRSIRNSVKLIVIICLMILSFSLILHANLGYLDENYKSLGDCLIKSIIALFGIFNTSEMEKYMKLYQYIFIIAFMIIIKFFVVVFIYSIIYHSFIQIYEQYKKYKHSMIYRIVGDFLNEMLCNLLMPFSFYFIVKKIIKLKRKFGTLNLEKAAEVMEDEKKIIYQKFDIEDRDVYYFYIDNNTKL